MEIWSPDLNVTLSVSEWGGVRDSVSDTLVKREASCALLGIGHFRLICLTKLCGHNLTSDKSSKLPNKYHPTYSQLDQKFQSNCKHLILLDIVLLIKAIHMQRLDFSPDKLRSRVSLCFHSSF